jgi:hypothetical protein
MAVSAKPYGNVVGKAFNKEIDLDTDTIKVALLANTYTPDQDAHDYFSDVSADEVTGTGYTAGGATLASKTATYVAGTNTFTFDAADVSWADSTITARYAVIYDAATGTPATEPLIAFVDFGADVSSSNGTFEITWDAAGIFTATVS